jgi:hypothetical protein
MKVLDLFSGLRGWSDPFLEAGHDVFTVDLDPKFGADLVADIGLLNPWDLPWQPDVVLASPPCEKFSVMTIGKHWYHDGTPKTPDAAQAIRLVERTLYLIDKLAPSFWIVENPRAKLRVLPPMVKLERRTVTYCQFGEFRMKPTDLWGGFPPSLRLPDPCKNGDPCHVRAVRGSRTGTQGMDRAESAKIPVGLAEAVMHAAERDYVAGARVAGPAGVAS